MKPARRSLLFLFLALLGLACCTTSAAPAPSGEPPATDGSSGAPGSTGGTGGTSGTSGTSGTTPTVPAQPGTSFSFVVVGCNRVEKADIDPAQPSTANVEQLTRTFAEVAALQPPPKYFFFAGDMVYGYTNGADLATQLQGWLALYAASPLPAAGVVGRISRVGGREHDDGTRHRRSHLEVSSSA